MPSSDLVLQYWPGWVSLAIGVLLTVNKLIEESEKFAKRLGPIGRKLRDRALKRHHVDLAAAEFADAVRKAVDKAVEEARRRWLEDENEAIKSLSGRLETVSDVTDEQEEAIGVLRSEVRCLTAYTEYEDSWHARLRAAAVRSPDGTILMTDLPHHTGYYDFEAKYRTNPNWRTWIDE